ncbi:MAG: BolA family transcriptional regulator [Thiomonas sp.]|nr:BolA family transcriptional regulator [Thiomonas sp.]
MPSTMSRRARIEALLQQALNPETLQVADDSAAHAGHGGFDAEGSHFRVRIVSARFTGASRLARHRLVYDALASMMHHEIHALVLDCQAPGEALQVGRSDKPETA